MFDERPAQDATFQSRHAQVDELARLHLRRGLRCGQTQQAIARAVVAMLQNGDDFELLGGGVCLL